MAYRLRFDVQIVRATAFVLALCAATSAVADGVNPPSRDADYAFGQVGNATRADAKYVPLFDPTAAWPTTFQWKYNAAGAPAGLPTASVVATLQAAFDKWSSQCNVKHQYAGETTTAPHATDSPSSPDFVNVVGWRPLAANSAWTYAWWQDSGPGRALVDADMELSPPT